VTRGVGGAWWLPQSSKLPRPDDVGLGGFDSHALPPTPFHDVTVRVREVIARAACALALAAVVAGLRPREASAQRADTVKKAAPTRAADTTKGARPELRPPLTPRTSFFLSFLIPGYAQSVLGRPRASALFIGAEAIGVSMLRQAQYDLNHARSAGQDSVVTSWWDPASGTVQRTVQASPYDANLLRSRHAHVEDWVAGIIANHLFSGLDAYVAANLWDLPAEMQVIPTSNGVAVSVTVHRR
jgi:hypothetical protein